MFKTLQEKNPQVYTNHHKRPILYSWDLSEKELEDFDYYDAVELEFATFFRYKGAVYDLGEFMRVGKNAPAFMQEWDGYSNDTFFSGILVKWPDDDPYDDSIIVGWYMVA